MMIGSVNDSSIPSSHPDAKYASMLDEVETNLNIRQMT